MSPRLPRDEEAGEAKAGRAREPGPPARLDETLEERFEGETGPEPAERDEREYRRRRRPVAVRRRGGSEALTWLKQHGRALAMAVLALAACAAGGWFLLHSAWFVLTGADQIQVEGNRALPASTVQQVFGADLGRNVFFIPLDERRAEVERIAWVRHAAVLRIWPNQLQVRLQERTPVALARCGPDLCLIDAAGTLMPRLGGRWDFAVISGLAGAEDGASANQPGREAQRRVQLEPYLALTQALDAHGAHGSAELSEVNVADPADLVVLAEPPGQSTPTLVHLGNQDLMARYQRMRDNIADWRRQYPNLQGVDLRFPGQVVLPTAPNPPATSSGGRAHASHGGRG